MERFDPRILSLFIENNCCERYGLSFYPPSDKALKKPTQIFNEIKGYCKKYEIREFEFSEPINLNLHYLDCFCSLIIKRKLDIGWTAPVVISPNMKERYFKNMKSAGCRVLIFNLFSVSDSLLKKIGLPFSVLDISNMLKLAKNCGIKTIIHLLLGYPGETEKNNEEKCGFLNNNIQFIDEIILDYCPSNYLANRYFPLKLSLCSNWPRCNSVSTNNEPVSFSFFDRQIVYINKLGRPAEQTSGLSIFREIWRFNIKPYSIDSHWLNLYADLEKRTVRIFYKNRELTKGIGLHTSFLCKNTWIDSKNADWQIDREDNPPIIRLIWKTLDLNQTWKFSFIDNILYWQIDHKGGNNLEYLKFGIFLDPEYKTFFCGHEEGIFPSNFHGFWEDLELENSKSEFFGVRKERTMPAVVLSLTDMQKLSNIIQNSDTTSACRSLQFGISKEYLVKGEIIFNIPIKILHDESFIEEYLREERCRFKEEHSINSYSINSYREDLGLLFSKGSGRLYYVEQELTKGLGLYTSIFSSGSWQDSLHAYWEAQKIDAQKIIAKGRWKILPLIQIWELEWNTENRLNWKIEMEVLSDLVIEGEEQINVMLTERYKNWFSPDGSWGTFPELFNKEWPAFLEKDVKMTNSIGVRSDDNCLPSVSLRCNKIEKGRSLSILNTSSSYCARKLKCFRKNNKPRIYKPGKYLYFDGEIEIGV